MKDFFSKIDKKYLYILGGILGAILLIVIILVVVKACSGPGNNYEKVESQMVSATERFLKSKGQSLPKAFESKEISASELAAAGYMKEMSKLLEDTSCVGKVAVYNYSGQYLYIPDLNCTDYKTKHLGDVIKKDNLIQVVNNEPTETTDENNTEDPNATMEEGSDSNSNTQTTSNSNVVDLDENDGTGRNYVSGLYEENGEFVFKGKNPNNYLKIGSTMFRILDIDSNGLMRVVNLNQESKSVYWDNKYNSDIKKSNGINEFKNSYLYSLINNKFASYKPENKKHMAYNKLCVGKRGSKQLNISKEMDCALTLEKQYIMLPLVSDFARASLDEHCTTVTNPACRNYNYLASIISSTWTSNALSENTYQAILISVGRAKKVDAKDKNPYNLVLTINGYEKYVSGKGTQKNPYVVGQPTSKKK
jgi:hypothetical protein